MHRPVRPLAGKHHPVEEHSGAGFDLQRTISKANQRHRLRGGTTAVFPEPRAAVGVNVPTHLGPYAPRLMPVGDSLAHTGDPPERTTGPKVQQQRRTHGCVKPPSVRSGIAGPERHVGGPYAREQHVVPGAPRRQVQHPASLGRQLPREGNQHEEQEPFAPGPPRHTAGFGGASDSRLFVPPNWSSTCGAFGSGVQRSPSTTKA